MKKALKFLNDNHHYIIAAIILLLACFWTYGCESKVNSILNPNQMVTRGELKIEVDYFMAHADLKFMTLDKQDELRQWLIDLGSTFAQTGTLNPTGLMNMAISVGAIAFGLNQRKRRINNSP